MEPIKKNILPSLDCPIPGKYGADSKIYIAKERMLLFPAYYIRKIFPKETKIVSFKESLLNLKKSND